MLDRMREGWAYRDVASEEGLSATVLLIAISLDRLIVSLASDWGARTARHSSAETWQLKEASPYLNYKIYMFYKSSAGGSVIETSALSDAADGSRPWHNPASNRYPRRLEFCDSFVRLKH
jgi:hypothetical protein